MKAVFNWEMAKLLFGLESVLRVFFNLLLLYGFIAVSGCSSHSMSDDDGYYDEEQEPLFSHPKKASAWETQALLLSSKQPEIAQIQRCRNFTRATAKAADNDQNLIQAIKTMVNPVSREPFIYHWCFYHMMEEIDTNLEKVGINPKERREYFYEHMKALFILARALDKEVAETNDSPYFSYLRERYQNISKSNFGRDLEIVGRPIDKVPTKQSPDR